MAKIGVFSRAVLGGIEGYSMKLSCRFCKIVFECETFEQIAGVQGEQCYITRPGITHELKKVKA